MLKYTDTGFRLRDITAALALDPRSVAHAGVITPFENGISHGFIVRFGEDLGHSIYVFEGESFPGISVIRYGDSTHKETKVLPADDLRGVLDAVYEMIEKTLPNPTGGSGHAEMVGST